jgi:hypothetical protein
MTINTTTLLGLALPVQGTEGGTWGDTVNNSITSLLDSAVAGTTTLSTDLDVTLTTTTLASNQARQAILLCSGARTALRTITAPAQSKIYTIINSTTGGYSVKLVGVGPTTGVTIANGTSAQVAWNGSDFVLVSTMSSAGVLPAANGGTGSSSAFNAAGVVYAGTTASLNTATDLTYDALTGLNLNFPVSSPSTSAFTISSANSSYSGIYAYTTTAYAADTGGSISLGGMYYTSPTNNTNFGGIAGRKENSTGLDLKGYLSFQTNDGSSFKEVGRFNSSGYLGIGQTNPTASLNTLVPRAAATTTSAIFDVSSGGTGVAGDINRLLLKTASYTTNSSYGAGIGAVLYAYGSYATDLALYYSNSSGSILQGARINSLGVMTVGTSSAYAKFEVSAGSSATAYIGLNTSGGPLVSFNGYSSAQGMGWLSNVLSLGGTKVTIGSTVSYGGTPPVTVSPGDSAVYFNNTTSPLSNAQGGFYFDYTNSTSNVIIGHASGAAAGSYYESYIYAGTRIGSITQSGTTAVSYNTTSDQRLKENIQDAAPVSDLIDAIQVRQYDWKADGSHQRYGFVAQELVTVAPEAVHQPENAEDMMAVDYSKLVPMLVKEIQSLRKRLAAAGL